MAENKMPQPPGTKAESSNSQDMRELVKVMMEEMMPAVIAATRHTPVQTAPAERRGMGGPTCFDCGQLTVACKGEHTMMVVYPTNLPEQAEWFRGAIINGKSYLSNDDQHAICVPKAAAGDILSMVRGWEQNEREQKLGRKKHRDSSKQGPITGQYAGAQDGWR
jgi:hypothetical protein